MKTKYLFYSLALSGMFAACTQEALVNEDNASQEALKNRPVAGMVEFSLNEVESRFNHAAGSFNDGETIDLYLMDELNGYFDEKDANHKHGFAESVECWKYFPVWQSMYSLVDYAQTRYPFAYDEAGEVWKNQATLLEGNYFAMHPSNEKITNRRDVWHYINPVMSFTNEAGEFDKLGAMGNQFWLGYAPIYRDEDRTGDMTLPLTMQPIMTVAKLKIVNNSLHDTKIDKIVFKDRDGNALPTIAYVKPAIMDQEDWRKTEEVENPLTANGCGALDCNDLPLNSKYSKELTWPSDATGRATARSLVQYATPAERVPYGLEDTEVAYEYVFNFEEDGHFLKGGVTNGMSNVEVYFVLPNDPSYTYEPVIYGRVNNDGEWNYGILKAMGADNKIFTLNSIDLTKNTPYVQNVTASFDNYAFEAVTEVRVSTTEDLMKYLKSFTTSYEHEDDFKFTVNVYGDDLAITDEVVDFLDEIAKNLDSTDANCPIQLTFKAVDRVNPATVTIATEKECMKYFRFPKGDVDVTIAKGNHTIDYNVNIAYLLVGEGATLNVTDVASFKAQTLHNEGSVVVENSNCENTLFNNHAEMELKGATINALRNEKNLLVSGAVTADVVYNDNTCVNCGSDAAVLTITGKLTVNTLLQNKDKIVNNGTLITVAKFDNDGTADMNGAAEIEGLDNSGTLNVNSAVTTINGQNEGTITVAEGAEVNVTGDNQLVNTGIIEVSGHLFEQIANYAEIFVIGNGEVVVNGDLNTENVAGIIDITQANDGINAHAAKDMAVQNKDQKNYFRYDVNDEETAEELDAALKARISDFNYTENGTGARIIVRWTNATTATEFVGVTKSNIHKLYINKNLDFVYDEDNAVTSFTQLEDVCWAYGIYNGTKEYYPAVVIGENVKVQVANYQTLNFVEGNMYGFQDNADGLVDEEALTVQVNAGAELKVNNHATVGDERVVLQGAGKVINATSTAKFNWENSVISPISVSNKFGW